MYMHIYIYTYMVREMVDRQTYLKALFTATGCRYGIFSQSQDRGMQKESKRTRQFGQLSDHFVPKRQPLPSSAFIPQIASTKGDLPRYFAEATVVRDKTKKRKRKKKRKRYGGWQAEKERLTQSVPCSRIMARTHCSNYSRIRLTSLSAEPAVRWTCVTNMRARPPAPTPVCIRKRGKSGEEEDAYEMNEKTNRVKERR